MAGKYLEGADRLRDALAVLQQSQIPFAVALGLTKTAQDVQKALTDELPRKLDRPTPFTRRAFAVRRATKTNPVALVNTRGIQADYLQFQVKGGRRTPARRTIPVPFGVKLNKYGNMPRRRVQQLLARKDTFAGVVKGIAGIWQRPKHRLGSPKLLVAFERQVQYRPRFPFATIAERTAVERIVPNMRRAVLQAIRTAR